MCWIIVPYIQTLLSLRDYSLLIYNVIFSSNIFSFHLFEKDD